MAVHHFECNHSGFHVSGLWICFSLGINLSLGGTQLVVINLLAYVTQFVLDYIIHYSIFYGVIMNVCLLIIFQSWFHLMCLGCLLLIL